MRADEVGQQLLELKPTITSESIDFDDLGSLPPDSFGHAYYTFMVSRGCVGSVQPLRVVRAPGADVHTVVPGSHRKGGRRFSTFRTRIWRLSCSATGRCTTSGTCWRACRLRCWGSSPSSGSRWCTQDCPGVRFPPSLDRSALQLVGSPSPLPLGWWPTSCPHAAVRVATAEHRLLLTQYIPWASHAAREAHFLLNVFYEDLLHLPLADVRAQLNFQAAPSVGREQT